MRKHQTNLIQAKFCIFLYLKVCTLREKKVYQSSPPGTLPKNRLKNSYIMPDLRYEKKKADEWKNAFLLFFHCIKMVKRVRTVTIELVERFIIKKTDSMLFYRWLGQPYQWLRTSIDVAKGRSKLVGYFFSFLMSCISLTFISSKDCFLVQCT